MRRRLQQEIIFYVAKLRFLRNQLDQLITASKFAQGYEHSEEIINFHWT